MVHVHHKAKDGRYMLKQLGLLCSLAKSTPRPLGVSFCTEYLFGVKGKPKENIPILGYPGIPTDGGYHCLLVKRAVESFQGLTPHGALDGFLSC